MFADICFDLIDQLQEQYEHYNNSIPFSNVHVHKEELRIAMLNLYKVVCALDAPDKSREFTDNLALRSTNEFFDRVRDPCRRIHNN